MEFLQLLPTLLVEPWNRGIRYLTVIMVVRESLQQARGHLSKRRDIYIYIYAHCLEITVTCKLVSGGYK